MADHSLPVLTSPYADYTAYLKGRLDDLLVALDPASSSPSNFPVNTMRYSSALNKWQTFDGSSWNDSSANYAINISGNAATATTLATARSINGVSFNGSASISVNTVNSVTFNNLGSGDVSGSTFDGGSAKTISYNTVGAPSVTGTNASGTWSIGVTGNAGSATKLATARNINGVSFDGTAAINVNLNNAATFSNAGGAASGSTFDGASAKTISYNTVGAPSTTGVNASGTWGINISGNANTATSASTVTFIPSGTIMLFGQTTAPTGWTKQTAHNNKALRVVSGTVTSGGSVAFTTAFANQSLSASVGSTTLTKAQMPSHDHTLDNNANGTSATNVYNGSNRVAYGDDYWLYSDYIHTKSTGGDGSHTHSLSGSINLDVQYVDVIMASKD